MKLKSGIKILHVLVAVLVLTCTARGQDFKRADAKIAEYKRWLESVRSDGQRLWVRLDSTRRPHKLYVGAGFHKADYNTKEHFVEIFSQYLAGYPDKFMLIDIYDAATGKAIGEFGWGGFKLY